MSVHAERNEKASGHSSILKKFIGKGVSYCTDIKQGYTMSLEPYLAEEDAWSDASSSGCSAGDLDVIKPGSFGAIKLDDLPKQEVHVCRKNGARIMQVDLANAPIQKEYLGFTDGAKSFVPFSRESLQKMQGVDAVELVFTKDGGLIIIEHYVGMYNGAEHDKKLLGL